MAVPPSGAGGCTKQKRQKMFRLLVLLSMMRLTFQENPITLNFPEPDQTLNCGMKSDKVCCAPENYNPFFTIIGCEPETVQIDPLIQITEQDQMPQANIDSFINFKENGKKNGKNGHNSTDLNSNQTEQTEQNSNSSNNTNKTVKINDIEHKNDKSSESSEEKQINFEDTNDSQNSQKSQKSEESEKLEENPISDSNKPTETPKKIRQSTL